MTGALLDISAERCTDGAWLTVRYINGVLIVVIDFEGLGSVERTDQEDTLLAVLNAAISNWTLFKIDWTVDSLQRYSVHVLKVHSLIFQLHASNSQKPSLAL